MSDLERRLEELFMSDSRSRRVDQVNVTGGARRRAPLAAAGFIGAVALAAVAAIFALNTMRPQEDQAAAVPSASSSATAAAPSATTSPTPTVSASGSATPSTTAATGAVRPDAAHGVITRGGSGGILRTEADAAARTTFSEYRGMAVTKDGKRVAYIRVGQTAQQLIVFETGSPGAQKTVMEFTGLDSAGGIVWSSESNAELLVQVDKRSATQPLAAESSSLRAVNVDTGAAREVVRSTSALLLPIAWHSSTNTGAAVETGDGGFAVSYDYISGGALQRSPIAAGQIGAFAILADPDGRRILSLGAFGSPRGVMWWPIDLYADRQELKPADGFDISRAFWRPGTDEIIVFASPTVKDAAGPAPRLEAWTTSGQRRTVAEGAGPLAMVRVDGTAAITTSWNLVDLVTGSVTPMPPGDGTQTPYFAVLF